MDSSTLSPEVTDKVLWSKDQTKHERKRLKKRAGTVTRGRERQWHPESKKKFLGIPVSGKPYYKKMIGGASTNIVEGKDPGSGKPVKRTHGGFGVHLKDKNEEGEY